MAANTTSTQGGAWQTPVDDRVKILENALKSDKQLNEKLPGLESLLDDYLHQDGDFSEHDFHRRLLRVFRDSQVDYTYGNLLKGLTPDERNRISSFVDGTPIADCCLGFDMGPSLGVREHLQCLHDAHAVRVSASGAQKVKGLSMDGLEKDDNIFFRFVHGLAKLFHLDHPDKDSVVVYKDAKFQNWGLVVNYLPTYTCVPSSVKGVQRIVKFAKDHDMGVRVSGFRHSWAPIFGRNGQILISLIGLAEAEILPNTTALPLPEDAPNELESIEVASGAPRVKGNALVRVGVSTTNERLRRWCVKNKKYTLPLNVIMVEMTIGGTNGPICHGAGRAHQTLSDLVRKVEYVDCHGHLRVVDKPEHLKAAAGCFGLMGVITHITFEMSPMSYALMAPKKIPAVRAVPPPEDIEIPPALRVEGLTPAQKAQDLADFERQAASDYYCEWFWFPYSDYCWVNCWNATDDPAGAVDYPNEGMILFQFISQFTMNVLQNAAVLNELITAAELDEATVTLLSRAAMFAMPDKPVKTYLTDALHFQRGIQNIRVLDLEVEMPLPAKPDRPDAPDFGLARRAWWDAILACYRHTDRCPQRMPLEMRVMGGSEVVMAPQRGNALGTCAIEVLTLESARDIWDPYAQEVLDLWMGYRDPRSGDRLKTRPHWAKQWAQFQVEGRPWREWMKESSYKEEIVEFKDTLAAIGKEHGWTLADLKKRFSNDFFDWFYFSDGEVKTLPVNGNGVANGMSH
ncbi:uncharacterized protein E0L32_000326 [Thyridium curvatum]|uniref:FAD-binding PCMH-type domain-containing protein n=1 Tax=Thyridium curvatum TaxID=1093900 RepID=A0A507B149_9PEZI|nr:uncharacterized protein E0L32_000326 [Thyridium curvatum]TPX15992.1 hypothetical protein E0L32_000326 [Thyridium curvatum]